MIGVCDAVSLSRCLAVLRLAGGVMVLLTAHCGQ